MISFKRKSVPLKFVTFAFAIGYMGFAKSYLISITNIFSVLDWNWPIVKYNLAWYLFFGFTVVSTILWGRLYCGRICAYGALTQTLDAILPAKWRVEVPRSIEKRAAWIKFGILGGVIAYYLVTHNLLIYQYTEPFWMFGLFGTPLMWTAARDPADGDAVRPQPVLPVPVPGRRDARPDVVPDGVPHQALVGVQHLPHLPEGVPVGRDRGAEDPDDRMRPLRRLRAALRRQGEVPALADHRIQQSQDRRSCRCSRCSRIPRDVDIGRLQSRASLRPCRS